MLVVSPVSHGGWAKMLMRIQGIMRDLYDFRAKSAIVALVLVTILAVLRVLWGYLSAL
jgi:hypothetical protein